MNFSNKRRHDAPLPLKFNNEYLTEANNTVYLGVILTSTLSWKENISNLINKASKRTALLKRISHQVDRRTLDILYKSMVRPLLEYGDVIFVNCTQEDASRLERAQVEAGSVISGAMNGTSHEKILLELSWDTLADRRTLHQLVLFYKMVNDHCPAYLTALLPQRRDETLQRNLRNTTMNYDLVPARTNRLANSFLPSSVCKWNSLPLELRGSSSIPLFKFNYKSNFLRVPMPYRAYGDKRANRIHARFRMGFSQLNRDLYIRNLVPSPLCLCGHDSESTFHYFLQCPLSAAARATLLECTRDHFSRNAVNVHNLNNTNLLKILLFGVENESIAFNKELMVYVHTFILDTHRFP